MPRKAKGKGKRGFSHKDVYERVVYHLGERSQAWLAERAGIGQSKLQYQMSKQRFTLDVLWAIAPPLGVDVADLIRDPVPSEIVDDQTAAAAFRVVMRLVRWAQATSSEQATAVAGELGQVLEELRLPDPKAAATPKRR